MKIESLLEKLILDDLEAYREQSQRELFKARNWIAELGSEAGMNVTGFEPTGDVLNSDRFRQDSNVTANVYVDEPSRPRGLLQKETAVLQRAMLNHRFVFGILHISVINQASA